MAGKGSQKGERRGGRQKGTPNKSRDEVALIVEKVAKARGHKDSSVLFDKLFQLAEGVMVEEIMQGVPIVYKKEPNEKAAKTVLEYRHGKPAQQVDITSLGERLLLQIVYGK